MRIPDDWMRRVPHSQDVIRLKLYKGRFVATFVATLCLLAAGRYIGLKVLLPTMPMTMIVAMIVYFLAHCLRAMRLCIISGSLLKIPARTTFWLHFATVPFAIILPFKIGEIVRLYNLWLVSKKLSESVVTILLDRLFDAIMLAVLLTWLIMDGHIMHEGARTVQWMTVAVTILAGICFLIGPRALSSLQRYVVINHTGRDVLVGLRLIDVLREGATNGEGLLRRQGTPLMMITVLIWGFELAAAALLTHLAVSPEFHNAGVLLINRAAKEWQVTISSHVDPALAASAASSILVILAAWPPSVYAYLNRIITFRSRSLRTK